MSQCQLCGKIDHSSNLEICFDCSVTETPEIKRNPCNKPAQPAGISEWLTDEQMYQLAKEWCWQIAPGNTLNNAQFGSYETFCGGYIQGRAHAESRCAARVEKLREALEFFAEHETWKDRFDVATQARQALAEDKK